MHERKKMISMSKFFAGGDEMMEWKTALRVLMDSRTLLSTLTLNDENNPQTITQSRLTNSRATRVPV